eukprot:TRINITY_DN38736_c0_g1_i2.p1 TRINITY_DN38736_c0_g1~~TRINITY_DN38736_c0_g1_i2.p1  ORF type:complete len:191 (-),score=8.44 TRINITY_DN38736_c0_g1_i2:163-684(-)
MPVCIGTDCSGLDAPIYAIRSTSYVRDGGLDVEHSWSCDIDPEARRFSEANHSPNIWFTDMTKRRRLPAVDVYCVGLPCQSFSGLGRMGGMADDRMSTYKGMLRVLRSGQAESFVLENVARLKASDSGNTFQKMMDDFRKAGYHCKETLYNSKGFGLPQSRQRLFIVGVKKQY